MLDFSRSPDRPWMSLRNRADVCQPAGPKPSDPPVTWCRKLDPGAHHACCALLQALFITAKALPVATTTTVVSTMNTVFIGDLVITGPPTAEV